MIHAMIHMHYRVCVETQRGTGVETVRRVRKAWDLARLQSSKRAEHAVKLDMHLVPLSFWARENRDCATGANVPNVLAIARTLARY